VVHQPPLPASTYNQLHRTVVYYYGLRKGCSNSGESHSSANNMPNYETIGDDDNPFRSPRSSIVDSPTAGKSCNLTSVRYLTAMQIHLLHFRPLLNESIGSMNDQCLLVQPHRHIELPLRSLHHSRHMGRQSIPTAIVPHTAPATLNTLLMVQYTDPLLEHRLTQDSPRSPQGSFHLLQLSPTFGLCRL